MRRGLALLVGLLGAAAVAQPRPKADQAEATYRQLELFARVLSYVDSNYVDPVDDRQLMYGAIKGMLETLDPHTQFYPPEVLAQLASKRLAEPGLELVRAGASQVVLSVVPDSPAQRSGLRPGDEVRAIDHEPAAGLEAPRVQLKLAGAPGSKLTLTIMREGFNAERDIVIVREVLAPVAVSARLHDGVGVLRVAVFQEKTDAAVGRELARLREENGGALAGLVLDLRDNPGGLVREAVAVADRFLPGNLLIVSSRGRYGQVYGEDRSKEADTEPAYPMVVLVNDGSASAAEIVAGALKDHHRAALLGLPTFGKGSVQTTIQMDDGSGLKLTVARYFTPSGLSIQETGITPDFIVPAQLGGALTNPGHLRERDLGRHLRNERAMPTAPLVESLPPLLGSARGVEGDHQLSIALQYLAWTISHPKRR